MWVCFQRPCFSRLPLYLIEFISSKNNTLVIHEITDNMYCQGQINSYTFSKGNGGFLNIFEREPTFLYLVSFHINEEEEEYKKLSNMFVCQVAPLFF